MRIGIVAQGLDGAANLALNERADRNCSIYHPRHSGGGDAGLFCNLSDVHVWSSPLPFCVLLTANAISWSKHCIVASYTRGGSRHSHYSVSTTTRLAVC